MKGFCLIQPQTIDVKALYRRLPLGTADKAAVDSIHVAVPGEARLLREMALHSLPEEHKGQKDKEQDHVAEFLLGYTEEQFLQWSLFPQRIGRKSTRLVDQESVHFHEEPSPLPAQLQSLRAKYPNKRHFSLAIINGFGSNLGDNFYGMTALRCVAKVMQQHLPHFSFDFLFGMDTSKANLENLLCDDMIEQVHFAAPSLERFGRYDAYFDFSRLTEYPQYHSMPTVDWLIWWMGLDPAYFSAEDKRNSMTVRWADWQAVGEALRRHAECDKLVFYNPKASVSLRSVPAQSAHKLAKRLLNADKKLQLVVDQPLNFAHKRILDVSKSIDSAEKFKALVAQVDGVISVNTFAPHVADAAGVPCVQICTVYPPDKYPYYPFAANANIPGYEQLPGYLKCKVDDDVWPDMEQGYVDAWNKLDAAALLHALTRKREERQNTQGAQRLQLVHEHKARSFVKADPLAFKREQITDVWELAQKALRSIGVHVLKPGARGVMVGAGQTLLACELARVNGPVGELHVFEPRRYYRELLVAEAVHRALTNICTHDILAFNEQGTVALPNFDPWIESTPLQLGNVPGTHAVPTGTLDSFGFEFCQLLCIEHPMPAAEVLVGAQALLRSCRPIVIMAPLTPDNAREACTLLHAADYNLWSQSCRADNSMQDFLVLALPAERKSELQGFTPIKIS